MRPPKHIREERLAKVATAVAAFRATPKSERETSKGYRLSPDPTIAHRFSIHPGKMFGGSSADSILTSRQKQSKYRMKDTELYDERKL